MTLHEYFLQFLTEWLQWAEANKNLRSPSDDKFSTGCGLCAMWCKWLRQEASDAPHDFCADPTDAAQAHMLQVAIKEGIYSPDGDYFGWYITLNPGPAHQWEPRLAWVRQYLAKHSQTWCNLRISFTIAQVPQDLQNLPKGWSLAETDDSGPHGLVAVFQVDHIPTPKEVHEVHQALKP